MNKKEEKLRKRMAQPSLKTRHSNLGLRRSLGRKSMGDESVNLAEFEFTPPSGPLSSDGSMLLVDNSNIETSIQADPNWYRHLGPDHTIIAKSADWFKKMNEKTSDTETGILPDNSLPPITRLKMSEVTKLLGESLAVPPSEFYKQHGLEEQERLHNMLRAGRSKSPALSENDNTGSLPAVSKKRFLALPRGRKKKKVNSSRTGDTYEEAFDDTLTPNQKSVSRSEKVAPTQPNAVLSVTHLEDSSDSFNKVKAPKPKMLSKRKPQSCVDNDIYNDIFEESVASGQHGNKTLVGKGDSSHGKARNVVQTRNEKQLNIPKDLEQSQESELDHSITQTGGLKSPALSENDNTGSPPAVRKKRFLPLPRGRKKKKVNSSRTGDTYEEAFDDTLTPNQKSVSRSEKVAPTQPNAALSVTHLEDSFSENELDHSMPQTGGSKSPALSENENTGPLPAVPKKRVLPFTQGRKKKKENSRRTEDTYAEAFEDTGTSDKRRSVSRLSREGAQEVEAKETMNSHQSDKKSQTAEAFSPSEDSDISFNPVVESTHVSSSSRLLSVSRTRALKRQACNENEHDEILDQQGTSSSKSTKRPEHGKDEGKTLHENELQHRSSSVADDSAFSLPMGEVRSKSRILSVSRHIVSKRLTNSAAQYGGAPARSSATGAVTGSGNLRNMGVHQSSANEAIEKEVSTTEEGVHQSSANEAIEKEISTTEEGVHLSSANEAIEKEISTTEEGVHQSSANEAIQKEISTTEDDSVFLPQEQPQRSTQHRLVTRFLRRGRSKTQPTHNAHDEYDQILDRSDSGGTNVEDHIVTGSEEKEAEDSDSETSSEDHGVNTEHQPKVSIRIHTPRLRKQAQKNSNSDGVGDSHGTSESSSTIPLRKFQLLVNPEEGHFSSLNISTPTAATGRSLASLPVLSRNGSVLCELAEPDLGGTSFGVPHESLSSSKSLTQTRHVQKPPPKKDIVASARRRSERKSSEMSKASGSSYSVPSSANALNQKLSLSQRKKAVTSELPSKLSQPTDTPLSSGGSVSFRRTLFPDSSSSTTRHSCSSQTHVLNKSSSSKSLSTAKVTSCDGGVTSNNVGDGTTASPLPASKIHDAQNVRIDKDSDGVWTENPYVVFAENRTHDNDQSTDRSSVNSSSPKSSASLPSENGMSPTASETEGDASNVHSEPQNRPGQVQTRNTSTVHKSVSRMSKVVDEVFISNGTAETSNGNSWNSEMASLVNENTMDQITETQKSRKDSSGSSPSNSYSSKKNSSNRQDESNRSAIENTSKRRIISSRKSLLPESPVSPVSGNVSQTRAKGSNVEGEDFVEQNHSPRRLPGHSETSGSVSSMSSVRQTKVVPKRTPDDVDKMRSGLKRWLIQMKEKETQQPRQELVPATTVFKKPVKPAPKKPVKPKEQNPFLEVGEIDRKIRRPKPKPYVTEKMYKFLIKKLQPKYHLKSELMAQSFVDNLCKDVSKVIRLKKNYHQHVEGLLKEMVALGLVNTRFEFYLFIENFLPSDFRIKSVPMTRYHDLCPKHDDDMNIHEPLS